MRYPFDAQHRFWVNVAFFYGFFHAVLAHHVHYCGILYHVYGLIDGDLSAVVKFVLHVENNLSLAQRSPEQVAVADG